jgi:hypothetical protein
MRWKAEYLQGKGKADLKQKYRHLLCESESKLEACPPLAISSFSQKYISCGIPDQWRKQRTRNMRYLLQQLQDWPVARPLFAAWPEGAAPLALLLVFRSTGEREQYRSLLLSHDVYCPIHWASTETAFPESIDLSLRILTIPTDQRYTVNDMKKVARVLLSPNSPIHHAIREDSNVYQGC